MANSRLCSIAGCGNKHNAHGFCVKHLYRYKKYGDPLAGSTSKGAAIEFLQRALTYSGNECLLWPFADNTLGYGTIKINRKTQYPHRIVCAAFNGPPPLPSSEAAHSCGRGNMGCIAGNHLSWKSRLDNQADRVAHGTYVFGERVGTSKLKEADVKDIRSMADRSEQRDIARKYGISQSMVSSIVSRKRWAWLD